MGKMELARRLFLENENMNLKHQIADDHSGYYYCTLLMDLGEYKMAHHQAQVGLKRARRYVSNDLEALFQLILVQIKSFLSHAEADWQAREVEMDKAIDDLRRSRSLIDLPAGLLARASLSRRRGRFEEAKRDLQEAFEPADFSEMRLHLADLHLESARLHADLGEAEEQAGHLAQARRLIDATGYGLRSKDLEVMAGSIGVANASLEPDSSNQTKALNE